MYNDTINMKISNMRVDNSPVTLYNTLFRVSKTKTSVEGYWLDSNGKVHFDYIIPVNYPAIDSYKFRIAVQELFRNGEICIFYKNFKNYGVLEYANGNEHIIKERIEIIEQVKPDNDYLNELLKNYGGLTMYKLAEDCYLIEIYNLNYGGDDNE